MWTTCYVHMSNKKNCGGELQGGGSYDSPPLVVRVTQKLKKVGSRKVKQGYWWSNNAHIVQWCFYG